ncbi:hypothetical protein HPB51_022113 [Rhipicephalus microplus]|uniref:Uncharacterized protein n=1 Tax=Rhipicephalus microplus TaxID=6941 RepID=A0A9J6EBL8_RHIMP|nr:hypothetical protein HPB51_022113 [Rhipicephalus microplus]
MKGDKTTSQKQAGRSKPAGARERCSVRHDDGALRSTSSVSSNRISVVATKVGVPGGETSFPTTTLSLGGGAHGRSTDTTGDDALPSVTSSASRAHDPTGAATGRVPGDRAKRASSRPSSASASCRAETRRKSALCSTSDIALPSMSSAETSSDDKSAIPTGRLAELAAVGDGTTSEASASDAACRTNCPKRAARRPSRYDDGCSPFFKQRKYKGRASSAPQKDPVASEDDLKMQWCRDCGKRLIPSEVVMFKGDTESAVEEVLAIIDTRITSSLCAKDDVAQQPLFKITNFTVY